MRPKIVIKVMIAALSMAGFSTAKDSPDEKREKTRKMAAQTLKDLYKLQPASKQAIEKSAGDAIFSQHGGKRIAVEYRAWL